MIGERISHYTIINKLGAGGMGEVYLAMDDLLKRRVAIKVLSHDLASNWKANRNLRREAQAAAELDHPNICTIHEIGEHHGRSYIAMQYVEGETLATRILREPLSTAEMLSVAIQLADALAAAHAVGIIHRDIKPHNIMLTPKGQVKVLDFGLATRRMSPRGPTAVKESPNTADFDAATIPDQDLVLSNEQTLKLVSDLGRLVGTIPYMSPEQVRGEAVDVRTDIFSFGTVMFEGLTGKPLFLREDSASTISAILTENVPKLPIEAENIEAVEEAQRILQKCLERDANSRYQSAKELSAELNELLSKSNSRNSVDIPRPPRPGTHLSLGKLAAVALVILLILSAGFAELIWKGPRSTASIPARLPVGSIAVLPLKASGDDLNAVYLSDGLTVSLINQLSQISNLKVIARNSAYRYKDRDTDARTVGEELNVKAILSGTIQVQDDDVIVALAISDASQNSTIWERRFTRKRLDVLDLQSEILREVVEELRPQSSNDLEARFKNRSTQNIEAYNQYLKGLFNLNKRTPEGVKTALASFQEAVKIDPNYALAYAGLADAYSLLDDFSLQPPKVSQPLAENAARRALAIDPSLGEAHSTLGLIYRSFKLDWTSAQQELERAVDLNPNYAVTFNRFGWFMISRGRFDEALMYMRKAQELDPRSLNINTAVGLPYYYSRNYDKAIAEYQRTLQLDSEFFPANLYLGLAYIEVGRPKEAIKIFERLKKVADGPDLAIYIAYAHARAGEKNETRKVLRTLKKMMTQRYVPPYDIAVVHAQLGENDQAMTWLDKAYQEHELSSLLKVEPMLDPLRSDQRFKALLQRLKLTD